MNVKSYSPTNISLLQRKATQLDAIPRNLTQAMYWRRQVTEFTIKDILEPSKLYTTAHQFFWEASDLFISCGCRLAVVRYALLILPYKYHLFYLSHTHFSLLPRDPNSRTTKISTTQASILINSVTYLDYYFFLMLAWKK